MSSASSSKTSDYGIGKGKAKDNTLTFEQAYEALKNSNPEELDEHHLTLWRRIQLPAADQDNEPKPDSKDTDGAKTMDIKDTATTQMSELSKAITFDTLSHEQLDDIIYMSLSAKRGAAGLSINVDSSAGDGTVVATVGKHAATPSSSSKTGAGHTSSGSSGSSGFIVGSASRDADPFASTPTRVSSHKSSDNWRSRGSGKTSPTSSSHRASASTNWRNGNANNTTAVVAVADGDSSPDSSSSRGPVTNRNAQAYFLPSSCLFVANLHSTSQDVDLEHDVTLAFKAYGTVFVKIRRDARGLPFAFVQFTNDHSAERAIREMNGEEIGGRPCRVEQARANRDFVLARRDGGILTVGEARPIVEGFGPIENLSIPNANDASRLGVRNVVVVRYQFYENGRAAVPAMQDHTVYRMFAHPDTDQATGRPMPSSRTPPSKPHSRFLTIYETDRRSIFVGDLIDTITEPVLRQHFGVFGMIRGVSVHRQNSIREEGTLNVFAFIEFEDAISAFDAIRVMNNTAFQGMNLRVMQKNSEHNCTRVTSRRAQRHSSGMSQSRRTQQFNEMQAPQMTTPSHQMPAYQGSHNPHWAQTPATPMSNPGAFNSMYGAYANCAPPGYYAPPQYWGVESPPYSQGYYQYSPVYHQPGAYDPNYYSGVPQMGAFTAPPPCYPGHYAPSHGPVPYAQPHYEPYTQFGGPPTQTAQPAPVPTYVDETAGAAASAVHIVNTIVAQNAAAKAAKVDAVNAREIDVEVDDTATNTDTEVDASTDAATDSGVVLDADEDTLVYEQAKM